MDEQQPTTVAEGLGANMTISADAEVIKGDQVAPDGERDGQDGEGQG